MCGRGVKCPRCPAAVKGTKTSKSHCHEKCMTGRRVSRQPEAGKPIHRGSSRGIFTATLLFSIIPFLLYQPAVPVCKDAYGSFKSVSSTDHAGISQSASCCHDALAGVRGDKSNLIQEKEMTSNKHGGNLRKLAATAGIAPEEILDFSANINPLGPPEWMRPLVSRMIASLAHYPDPDCAALIKAISARYGVAEDEIVAGNGSTELIYLIPRNFP